MDQSLHRELPNLSIRTLFDGLLAGEQPLELRRILTQLAEVLLQSVSMQLDFVGQMMLLSIVFALLSQLETSFTKSSLQKVTGFMVQTIAVLLLLKSSTEVFSYGQEAMVRLAELMQMLLPIQLLLMAGLGNIQTAGLLQPSLLLIVQLSVWFFQTVLLPVITLEFVLKLVNSFSDTYKLQGLATFLRKLLLTSLAFITMLFLAVLSIQGISGHVLDRLSLRTAKYFASMAIPMIGGTISGLLETFLSGAMMIRGAIGFIGLLVVLLLTLVPSVKLLAIYFLYQFTAAILQPIGDRRITGLLEQAAGTYMLLFAVVALSGVFFFFMILIVLAASGAVLS